MAQKWLKKGVSRTSVPVPSPTGAAAAVAAPPPEAGGVRMAASVVSALIGTKLGGGNSKEVAPTWSRLTPIVSKRSSGRSFVAESRAVTCINGDLVLSYP